MTPDDEPSNGVSSEEVTPQGRAIAWTTVVLATLIAGATAAAIWVDAVPRAMVCPAVYPAPDWCTPGARHRSGATWTAVVVTVWALVVTMALTLGRRARWLLGAGVVVLAVLGFVAYGAVMGSTGYTIG